MVEPASATPDNETVDTFWGCDPEAPIVGAAGTCVSMRTARGADAGERLPNVSAATAV
jgi:hypothetical protein